MRRWLACASVLLVAACSSGSSSTPSSSATPAAPSVTGPARVTQVTTLAPRLLAVGIASPSVGPDASAQVILPPDYAKRPTSRWPVLYLLHGCCDVPTAWTANTDIVQFSARWNVLIVVPDGGRVGFYSNWKKGPQWETFHLVELRKILQQRFRASDVMAVAGLSMGGFGALGYAARHPGMFRAAASFSGIVNTRESTIDSQGYQTLVSEQGGDPDGLWGDPETDAAVWKAHNPYDLANRLRGTALFVSAGNGVPGPLDGADASTDTIEDGLGPQNERFVAHLRALHVPVTADLYGPGTHTWPYWQRELHRAWPMLTHALAATRLGA